MHCFKENSTHLCCVFVKYNAIFFLGYHESRNDYGHEEARRTGGSEERYSTMEC